MHSCSALNSFRSLSPYSSSTLTCMLSAARSTLLGFKSLLQIQFIQLWVLHKSPLSWKIGLLYLTELFRCSKTGFVVYSQFSKKRHFIKLKCDGARKSPILVISECEWPIRSRALGPNSTLGSAPHLVLNSKNQERIPKFLSRDLLRSFVPVV